MAHGRYSQFDDRALWEHTADKVSELVGVVARHDATLKQQGTTLEHVVPKIDLVLRPHRPSPMLHAAALAAAAAIVVTACAMVALVVILARPTSASASTQNASAQASNHVQVP